MIHESAANEQGPVQFADSSTSCEPYHKIYPDPSSHSVVIAIVSLLYSLVFLLGLAGNFAVIFTTCRHKSLQTVQNIFIVNLAVSDVILCLISIPLTPTTSIFKEWYFGVWLCRLVGAMQALGFFIGTFSLCAIAIDRYLRLVHAPSRPVGKACALRSTALIWLISAAGTLPYAIYMDLTSYESKYGICGVFCVESWPSADVRTAYTLFVLFAQFVLPFGVMAFCYRAVFGFLRKRATTRLTSIAQQANVLYLLAATTSGSGLLRGADRGHYHQEQLAHLIEQKKQVTQRRRRVTIILASMVVVFGLTALPHNIVTILLELKLVDETMRIDETPMLYVVQIFAHFMAMTCCIANPFLYAFLNPEFRDSVLASFGWRNSFLSHTNRSIIDGGARHDEETLLRAIPRESRRNSAREQHPAPTETSFA